MTGLIHFVDPVTHELRIEVKDGEFEWVAFDSVVGVKVVNEYQQKNIRFSTGYNKGFGLFL
ncbi:hypothetical protein V7139_28825 [Neobacillus drentensis]